MFFASCPKPFELAGQFDTVVDGELGARTDGEMRGMGGIAHQHDMAPAVEMAPAFADQAVEIEPGRAAKMARIGHQRRAVEHLGEQLFAEGDRPGLVELAETVRLESLFSRLDDEGRGRIVETIDMRLEPAVLRPAEIEGEGVVELVGAEPDVAVRPHLQVRLEAVRIAVADLREDAVGSDDEVGVRIFEIGLHFLLEHEFDAQLLAPRLQDVEQFLAADADEAMARCALARALEIEFDVVPVIEGDLDLRRRFGVPGASSNPASGLKTRRPSRTCRRPGSVRRP